MPTLKDVAALAGVSYQTVSRVMNENKSVRPSTRTRVLAAVTELAYVPNEAARTLRAAGGPVRQTPAK